MSKMRLWIAKLATDLGLWAFEWGLRRLRTPDLVDRLYGDALTRFGQSLGLDRAAAAMLAAVIEAAKAYIDSYGDTPEQEPHEAFVPLNDAVEALQALEREE